MVLGSDGLYTYIEERLNDTEHKVKTLSAGIQLRNYGVLVIVHQTVISFSSTGDWLICCG